MKKIYFLETCSTCKRIMNELGVDGSWAQREIKSTPITEEELQEMYQMAGSYESLFSRRAIKYRSMGLNEMELGEEGYKKYLLQEYTFLKRPVVILGDNIFIGNSKKTVEQIKSAI